MENLKYLRTEGREELDGEDMRKFYSIYRQAVLQELKEQGLLDDFQLQLCLQNQEKTK